MHHTIIKNQYTTLGPDEIWRIYHNVSGIFRGGGGSSSLKLARTDGPRRSDLLIIPDPHTGQEMVHSSPGKGLSFADSVEILSRKRIEGYVWKLPKGARLPEGLVFHVKEVDHPLLNVSRILSVLDMTVRLTQLADMMVACQIKIDRTGSIIEQVPGALTRAKAA